MTIVAFDGLSAVGKSTLVKMTHYRTADSLIVRENAHDPYREATAAAAKLIKHGRPLPEIHKDVSFSHPSAFRALEVALLYSELYCKEFSDDYRTQSSTFLAYMFTCGRAAVDAYVRQAGAEHELVLLDRWQRTGWAYQANPPRYPYTFVRGLNEEFEILLPYLQFILACPVSDIPKRRGFRDKIGRGTAGQMSPGREHEILPVFQEIYLDEIASGNKNIFWIENSGEPSESLEIQIKQAAQTYRMIEAIMRSKGIKFISNGLPDDDFWLRPEVLDDIYKYQTNRA